MDIQLFNDEAKRFLLTDFTLDDVKQSSFTEISHFYKYFHNTTKNHTVFNRIKMNDKESIVLSNVIKQILRGRNISKAL